MGWTRKFIAFAGTLPLCQMFCRSPDVAELTWKAHVGTVFGAVRCSFGLQQALSWAFDDLSVLRTHSRRCVAKSNDD